MIESDTNLITKYIKEHPEINQENKELLSSALEEQSSNAAQEIIGELLNESQSSNPLSNIEGEVDFKKIREREDLEKIIAAGISIAKEKDQLPDTIADKVNTPTEIASNAFDAVTIIEAIQRTISGDFTSVEKMVDYLIDMATVKVVAITACLVEQGVETFKAFAKATALVYGGESLRSFVEYVLDYLAPAIEELTKAGLTQIMYFVASKIKKWCHQTTSKASNYIKEKNRIRNLNLQIQ